MKLTQFIKQVEEVSSLPVFLMTKSNVEDLKEGVYITPSINSADSVKQYHRVKVEVMSKSFTKCNEVSMQISQNLLVDKTTYINVNGGGILNNLGMVSLIKYYEFVEKVR